MACLTMAAGLLCRRFTGALMSADILSLYRLYPAPVRNGGISSSLSGDGSLLVVFALRRHFDARPLGVLSLLSMMVLFAWRTLHDEWACRLAGLTEEGIETCL